MLLQLHPDTRNYNEKGHHGKGKIPADTTFCNLIVIIVRQVKFSSEQPPVLFQIYRCAADRRNRNVVAVTGVVFGVFMTCFHEFTLKLPVSDLYESKGDLCMVPLY